jgi:hypothetical protein
MGKKKSKNMDNGSCCGSSNISSAAHCYRIIDVNYNRLVEGLRVVEDIVRFVCNNKALSWSLRSVKNNISRIIYKYYPSLIVHRDVEKDFGKEWTESKRKNLREIFFANFARVKESVRVLEEFVKLFSPSDGKKIKALRFRVYKLEKELFEKNKIEV